ncbi:hypothetical protein ACQCSX_11245 [Pseudarthrobacter sp. P1]|uniref:sunset domain-containing protein n=1 Tax=Pseudarthrobacter sp. P1 TaxID=3418418 RepID=UPI003CEBF810
MFSSTSRPFSAVRLGMALAATLLLAMASVAGAAQQAHSAGVGTTRVASFSAGPAAVTAGNAITVQGQVQRQSGRSWVPTSTVALDVYFDPDGAKPNAKVRSIKSNAAGHFTASVTAAVSGRWSARVAGSPAVKASVSAQKYVQVLPRTSAQPINRTTCPAWAPIKGNASSHIYHLPGQRFYTRTNPEICFATETAARQAGYRRSKI